MKEREAKALGENDHCETCKNTGLMICPSHMVEKDEDGWCKTCDSPDLSKVTCYCQDE